MNVISAIVSSARPRQWIKNGALFLSILFSGHLFESALLGSAFAGFISFCLLSSSQYIINDILDIRSDRAHPYKKFRPVAKGLVSVRAAMIAAILFGMTGLLLASLISWAFFLIAVVFVTFQYLYAILFKNIPVIDVLTITVGYVIRVYAGAVATGYHVPVWLVTAAVMFAMLLAVGKRRAEFILSERHRKDLPKDVRDRLRLYSERLLDTYMATFGTAAFLTYVFFTFFSRIERGGSFIVRLTESDNADRKWMMITIPFVLFAIMRYMQLVYEKQNEVLEKVLTRDRPLIMTSILWGITVLFVVYVMGG